MPQDPKLQSIVQRMIDANESEENIASVIREYKPVAAVPSVVETGGTRSGVSAGGRGTGYDPNARTWGEVASMVLPIAASGAAAIATGGASLPIQLAGQAGAGLLSGAVRSKISGGSNSDAMMSGGMDAATNVAFPIAGKVLRTVAPALMEGALRINAPLARKFGIGNLGETAVENRIIPDTAKYGAAKAANLGRAASAEKTALLSAADQRATMNTRAIAAMASHDIAPNVTYEVRAGVRTGGPPGLPEQFADANPNGMSPTELDRAKSVWDDISDADRRALHTGKRIGAEEKAPIRLASQAREGLEQVAPGYKAINRKVMNLKGVELAAQGRADIPARGLDNLAAGYGTAEALAHGDPKTALTLAAMRGARMPAVMGGAAIVLNEIGKTLLKPGAPPTAEAIRAAIMALLTQQAGK